MANKYVKLEVAEGKHYAFVTIARNPVNSMNLDVWNGLMAALEEAESRMPSRLPATNSSRVVQGLPPLTPIRGIIIRSGLARPVFTAGNDITELFKPQRERYIQFQTIQNVFLGRLMRSPLVTIVAIRGACPAGGCVVAMCCDHRIITSDGTIGLNEVALGIPVPYSWLVLLERLVGGTKAAEMTLQAKMLNAKQALEYGLVEAVVDSPEALVAKATEVMDRMLRFPDEGRHATKAILRNELSEMTIGRAPIDVETGYNFLNTPEVVASLGGVLKRLSSSKM
ncbi:ClpP/crotonase [Cladochytrium replicatum]|nr:ClpP/crotonase [Cladochytrium replicatum]